MKVTVKHKAKQFKSDWWSTILIALYLLWYRNYPIEVEVAFDDILDLPLDKKEEDWLKICGWKDGVITKTNKEHMFVYRRLEIGFWDDIDYGAYRRDGKKVSVNADNLYELDAPTSAGMILERPKGLWIPCTPWAGGTELPLYPYEYQLTLNAMKPRKGFRIEYIFIAIGLFVTLGFMWEIHTNPGLLSVLYLIPLMTACLTAVIIIDMWRRGK